MGSGSVPEIRPSQRHREDIAAARINNCYVAMAFWGPERPNRRGLGRSMAPTYFAGAGAGGAAAGAGGGAAAGAGAAAPEVVGGEAAGGLAAAV